VRSWKEWVLPVVVVLACGAVILRGRSPNESPDGKGDAKKTESTQPEIAVLERFGGAWKVTENHFNAKGEVVATVNGTEEIITVLDKHAIRRSYATGRESSVFRAIGILAWNQAQKRYEGTWFDNTSTTGPTHVTGTWDEASLTMTFNLTSSASDAAAQQYKVVERFTDDEHRIAATYKVRGNEAEKVLEVQYVRTIPCPAETSGMRMIDPELKPPKGD